MMDSLYSFSTELSSFKGSLCCEN